MAGKSDFAQKLLHDLKLRKERMASTHNSSSRDFTGNTSKTYQEARKTKADSSTTCNNNSSRRLNKNITKSSSSRNQVVLFDKGSKNDSSPQKVEDLSMAIAFAFENNGNISKIGVHSSNPLVNFFNRFARRSSRSSKSLEVASVNGNNSNKHGVTTYEFSNVSHIHIGEISEGIQKLNRILSTCSNGDSVEAGRELLKGAMDLEESLKMLANFQGSSDPVNRGGKKSDRIRLLEEDEDNNGDREIYSSKKQVDRPRFSFDKPKNKPDQKLLMLPYHEDTPKQSGSDFKVVPRKRSTSCVPEFNAFSSSVKEKGKISNVIAKLMGLEEMPRNEDDNNLKKNDSSLEHNEKDVKNDSSLERKVNNVSSKKSDGFNDLFDGNNKIIAKPDIGAFNKSNEKSEKRPQRSSNWTDLGKNKVITDTTDGKVRVLNEQKALIDDKVKDVRVLRKINEEKRKVTMHNATRNKQMAHNKTGPHHVQSLEKPKVSEDKNDSAKQKMKQSHQKHNSVERRHKENQIESMKVKQDSQNLKKKRNRDKLAQENAKSANPVEETALKDPIITDISEKIASDKVKIIKQDHNLISVAIEESKDDEKVSNRLSLEKHAGDRLATKKNAIIQKNENLRKIDVLLTRRSEGAINHSMRSSKHSANMLQDLKERMNKKNLSKQRIEQQAQENIGEVVDIVAMPDSVEKAIKEETNQKEDEETILKDDSVTGEKACDDLESLDQPYASMHEREFKEKNKNSGDHNESITALKKRQDPLTDLEKDFKETIIKDQLFLNTAEALYKLNLPVTFLQVHDHQNNEVSDKKILLECGYEVMKRKAMRQEHSLHPLKRCAINRSNVRSLDDLVKQLCKDFDTLKVYGGECNDEHDIANCLYKMVDKDIYGKYPDVNCMWDHKWNMMKTMFSEMEDVVKDVEKHMINGLLDEITHDLVPVILAV